ncbi:murein hydrolase effector protein LrgB [Hypericibacter adhaerens]|jgi:predicted murein hydrolase (TIGR00659 family)|uniref:Murein hydrolase effector protein LrgB n=1 Tax=Hypericibacter adhaerens TaxID=2602016 RepID=A0A5J6N5I8_9PROT|nr:LrgB family protein [Hypericibacter adhaerens]QEX25178.1 murein hydrolase effector protein LrgB [Hypericibacter adhaerens]
MERLAPWWSDPLLQAVFWSAATIGLYWASKILYRRWRHWWLSPLTVTPLLLIVIVLALHAGYRDYSRATHWLMALLGPATVAFALPIYEQRALIRRHWPVLLIGVTAGSMTAMLSAWGLASLLGLDGSLRLSLLPRSMSTPFAMTVSGDIGGVPDLTAVFVMVTGVLGAALGEIMLVRLPIRSALARGALLGMGAHGAGTAKAHEIGPEEGSIAGLVMVLVGLFNVLAAPLLAYCLRA